MDRRVFLNAIVAAGIAPAFADASAMTDWTPNYLAALPVRTWGDTSGDCISSAWAYCIELRGILQGLSPVRVSELDLYYRERVVQGDLNTTNVGSWPDIAATISLDGVCREDLWPYTLTQGPGGSDDYQAMITAINTAPNAAAVADRPHQKAGTYATLNWNSLSDFTSQVKAALAARYPISVFWPPNHQVCAMGWAGNPGAEYFIGFDPRSTNAQLYNLPFATVAAGGVYDGSHPNCIILESVAFTGSSGGQVPTTTNLTAATFAVSGNKPTGTVSIVATYSGDANNLPSTSAPLVLPVAPSPPSGQITITYGQSLTDGSGHLWAIGLAPRGEVTRDGNNLGPNGFWAVQLIWTGSEIRAQNQDNGSWFTWTGTRWVPYFG